MNCLVALRCFGVRCDVVETSRGSYKNWAVDVLSVCAGRNCELDICHENYGEPCACTDMYI